MALKYHGWQNALSWWVRSHDALELGGIGHDENALVCISGNIHDCGSQSRGHGEVLLINFDNGEQGGCKDGIDPCQRLVGEEIPVEIKGVQGCLPQEGGVWLECGIDALRLAAQRDGSSAEKVCDGGAMLVKQSGGRGGGEEADRSPFPGVIGSHDASGRWTFLASDVLGAS